MDTRAVSAVSGVSEVLTNMSLATGKVATGEQDINHQYVAIPDCDTD